MTSIYETNNTFDFTKLQLLSPTTMPGGNYFIKFRINDSPLYIQTPKCKTKQAFLKSGKKYYCDLMFTNENENFIQWMENLETHCRKVIFDNRARWFETELDEHDIENSFTSPLKIYKSGKYYISRTNVPTALGNCTLKIYNEDETIEPMESVQENTDVLTVLEIQGIKCSPRNFQIEMEIKQMMIMKPQNLFEKCIFKNKSEQVQITPPVNAVETYTPMESVTTEQPYTQVTEEATNNTSVSTTHLEKNEPTENIHFELDEHIPNQTLSNTVSAPENENENVLFELDELHVEKEESETPDILEVDFDLDKLPENDKIQLKQRNDIYYEMYRDAKRKAKIARDLAVSSYLEAKNIKMSHMLEDDSDSDFEDDTFFQLTI